MSSETLTIVVGAVGVIATAVAALLGYWLAYRAARETTTELGQVRQILKNNVLLGRSHTEMGEPATAGAGVARPTVGSSRVEAPSVALERLVRASLGALVNDRGQVEVSRLLSEVGEAFEQLNYDEVVAILGNLRDRGIVSWDGASDLTDVEWIQIEPSARATEAVGASAVEGLR